MHIDLLKCRFRNEGKEDMNTLIQIKMFYITGLYSNFLLQYAN